MIELEAGHGAEHVRIHVDAAHGGRVAQIEVGRFALLVDDPDHGPMGWGSYPMVPWAGRIGHGRFTFDGRAHQLPINLDPHAIHGTGFTSAWTVDDAGRDHVDLSCRLRWAFGGLAQQHLQLVGSSLVCLLGVLATDGPMPVTLGWHPWFRKPVRADLHFGAMYERSTEHLPTGRQVEPAPPPWDDCFVRPLAAPRLHYPGLTVTVDSDCDHWVVYDEPAHATCVEPQSGPPDAVNLGLATRLEAGELLQRRMTIAWQVDDAGRRPTDR